MSDFSDSFTRADTTGGLGSPWVESSASIWGISSNQAYDFGPGAATQTATYDAGSADVELSVTLNAIAGTRQTSLVGRYTNGSNYWHLFVYSDASLMRLYKTEAGNPTIEASKDSLTISNGAIVKLRFSGNSIKVYHNGVEITDMAITSSFNASATKHGIITDGSSNSVRWDDFVLTDLSAPPPEVKPFGRTLRPSSSPGRTHEFGLIRA